MKKLIFIYILLASIIGISVWESWYITKAFDFLEYELTQIEQKLKETEENINTKENVESLKILHKEWQKKCKVLKIFVWHTGIKDVEVTLSRITTYTQENNYTEAVVELNNLKDFSTHYANDFKIKIENIF